MSCIRGRRGSNQKEEPYLGENVLPTVYHVTKPSWNRVRVFQLCIPPFCPEYLNQIFDNLGGKNGLQFLNNIFRFRPQCRGS